MRRTPAQERGIRGGWGQPRHRVQRESVPWCRQRSERAGLGRARRGAVCQHRQSRAGRTPVANHWWLDVESANSWRADDSLNVAALQGGADYLVSVGAASVGFYSAPFMWADIVGSTSA